MSTVSVPTRPLPIGPLQLDVPVVLAPMAGITNTAFRRLCREYGAGLYVSEMITSRALVERTRESMRLIRHHESETPRSVQLYGVDPATVEQAVRMLRDEDRADHIDLNLGCPVPEVRWTGGGGRGGRGGGGGGGGSAARRSLFSPGGGWGGGGGVAAGSLPLTIKMRK